VVEDLWYDVVIGFDFEDLCFDFDFLDLLLGILLF
jgi:hypothetical protein